MIQTWVNNSLYAAMAGTRAISTLSTEGGNQNNFTNLHKHQWPHTHTYLHWCMPLCNDQPVRQLELTKINNALMRKRCLFLVGHFSNSTGDNRIATPADTDRAYGGK